MGSAWIDGYWITYDLAGNIRISFEVTGESWWPWMLLTSTTRFDVIKAQLDTGLVWVAWIDSSHEVYRIVSLKRW